MVASIQIGFSPEQPRNFFVDFPGVVLFRYKFTVVENVVKNVQQLFRLEKNQTNPVIIFFFFHKTNTNIDEFKVDVSRSVGVTLNRQILRKLVGQLSCK